MDRPQSTSLDPKTPRPAEINTAIAIGIFAVIAFAAYWFLWFVFPGVVQARTPADPDFAIYEAYELAFPLPDAFVAIAALVGVVGLMKMRAWGFLAILLASGGALFLGLEDLLFDFQHNMFSPFDQAAVIELLIVLLLLGLGPLLTALVWRHRSKFMQ